MKNINRLGIAEGKKRYFGTCSKFMWWNLCHFFFVSLHHISLRSDTQYNMWICVYALFVLNRTNKSSRTCFIWVEISNDFDNLHKYIIELASCVTQQVRISRLSICCHLCRAIESSTHLIILLCFQQTSLH